jgi:hypothetical protein
MISRNLIERGGSKLEITRALVERDIGVPVPVSTWRYYDQSIDSIGRDFERMRKPVIVRGSHANDYDGFIDVIPTYRDIHDFRELEEAVRNIERVTESDAVRVHCDDWGQPYTPEVHILVQEQSPSPILGSMIRHPHDRSQLRIQYYDVSDDSSWRAPVSHATKDRYDGFRHKSHIDVTDQEIMELIEMYERLEASGIVDEETSQQMEFGLRPLLFFQSRQFRRFEPAKGFDIPWSFELDHPYMTGHDFFGITPEDGIELPFIPASCSDVLWYESDPITQKQRYGLILADKLNESPPTGKRFGKLAMFCSPCQEFNYLFHNNFRLMRMADYSVVDFMAPGVKKTGLLYYNKEDLDEFRRSRLFSNGNHGIIIPTKYL